MRGVKEELIPRLNRNLTKTVAEFVPEVTDIEKALDGRSGQYDRQVTAFPGNALDTTNVTTDAVRNTIRAIVREALRKLFSTTLRPEFAFLNYVIREEVQQELETSTPPEAVLRNYHSGIGIISDSFHLFEVPEWNGNGMRTTVGGMEWEWN